MHRQKRLAPRPHKLLLLLLALTMVFTLLPAGFAAAADNVASWNYSLSSGGVSQPIAANSGTHMSGAGLTASGARSVSYGTSQAGFYCNGWNGGNGYWQITFSSSGYENLTLNASVSGSGTGPRNFKVQYSLNGTTFTDTGKTYQILSGTKTPIGVFNLPAAVNNAGMVYIRFLNTDTDSVGGGTTGSNGTSYINNIVVQGDVATEQDIVSTVTAAPPSGYVTANTQITLNCATPGATIHYSIDGGDYEEYTDPFTLDTFPATVTAYGTKDGFEDGPIATFNYDDLTIAEARALSTGTAVTVRGVVTRSIPSSAGSQNNCTVFIEDDTAGIGLYKSYAFSPDTYPAGTTVEVSGTLSLYQGLLEITDATVTVDTSVPVVAPTPQVITVMQLMTGAYQGQFVQIEDSTLTAIRYSDSNHTILQSGVSTTLRCTGDVTLTGFAVGNVIDAVGVAGIYEGAAQLLVQSQADISLAGEGVVADVTADPASGAVEIDTTITLSSVTSGATIYYSINEGPEMTYTTPFTLDTLPATVTAYAEKDGVYSNTSTFNYTQLGLQTIAEARAETIGETVLVTGVVTRSIPSSAPNQNNCTVFIEDDTAGIGIYKSSSFSPGTYPAGTTLTVRGELSEYNGLLEIIPADLSDVVVEDDPIAPRTPQVITVAQLMTGAYQGEFVKIEDATLAAIRYSDSNHTISQSGYTTTLRCTGDVTLTGFQVDNVIDAVGVAGIYSGLAQLLVQSEADISLAGEGVVAGVTADPASGAVEIDTTVTLSSATPDATIYYSINEGPEMTYTTPFTLDTLPATVTAYAEKDGVYSSTSTFNYTQLGLLTIAAARAETIGETVLVTGVVTRSIPSSASNPNNCTVFIEDDTAGIGIYKSSSFSPGTYPAGTTLTVRGTLSVYQGLLEIQPTSLSDVVVEDVPLAPRAPQVITVAQLMTDDYQGEFVKIEDTTLDIIGTNSNHTISQSGTSTTLRCTGSTTLTGFAVNDEIDAVGVAGNYNGTAQILVQSQDDISLTGGVTIIYGDVDGDGFIAPIDTLRIMQMLTGQITLTPEQRIKADVDGDGNVGPFDAMLIMQYVVKIIDSFPVSQP